MIKKSINIYPAELPQCFVADGLVYIEFNPELVDQIKSWYNENGVNEKIFVTLESTRAK